MFTLNHMVHVNLSGRGYAFIRSSQNLSEAGCHGAARDGEKGNDGCFEKEVSEELLI